MAIASLGFPFIVVLAWNPGAGFGAKYADPATLPANHSWGVAFCGDTDIAVAHTDSPYVTAYPWTPGTGFGVKYADPGILPANDAIGVAFCGNTDIAVAHIDSPYVTAYPWTPGAGFGAKYADPGILPAGNAFGVAFCGDTDIAIAHIFAPYVTAYPWTPGAGFGVKYADPGILPANDAYGVAFCGDTDIAVAHMDSPYVTAYPWTPGAGFGVKYADPGILPANDAYGVAFCGDTDIAVAHIDSPYVTAYPWTPGAGFGAKYADPGTPVNGDARSLAFSAPFSPPFSKWTDDVSENLDKVRQIEAEIATSNLVAAAGSVATLRRMGELQRFIATALNSYTPMQLQLPAAYTAVVTVPGGAGASQALGSITLAGLPAGAVVQHLFIGFQFAERYNSAALGNALNGAQNLEVDVSGGGYNPFFAFAGGEYGAAATSLGRGDFNKGTVDLAPLALVDGDVLTFQWTTARANNNNLLFYEFEVICELWYTLG